MNFFLFNIIFIMSLIAFNINYLSLILTLNIFYIFLFILNKLLKCILKNKKIKIL